MKRAGLRGLAFVGAAIVALGGFSAAQANAASCEKIVFSDPQWTDITSTNALTGTVLKALGYEQRIETISVPVTFKMLTAGQIDVFQGNWMPAQTKFVDPLKKDGKIDIVHKNLEGAKFTLAVPDYVAKQGVHSFKDLAKYANKFDHKIYGIEPGAAGNLSLQKMIDSGDFNLKDWELVESSEQAMLSQVKREQRDKGWIVFLAWAPHPMNNAFDLTYLKDGDKYFGPNFGGADVYTLTREGFAKECPNVDALLKNVTFNLDLENTMMGLILNDKMTADDAAEKVLRSKPELLDKWLEGVKTIDGKDGRAAVKEALGS
jgi:glycine betaine/proline transport system substrate-binding protein